MNCKHPPTRLYAWTAADGTFCVGCCDCGKPLQGAVTEEELAACRKKEGAK